MAKQAELALFMPDLTESVEFYIEMLGFNVSERYSSADVVQITGTDGIPFLLAGPNAGDVSSYLTEPHFDVKPDDVLAFPIADLDALYTRLREKYAHIELVEKRWGDRFLDIYDPGGYHLRFSSEAQHSEQESLTLYMAGVDELEEAVANLTESELELTLQEDSWTIRHIVHHLADTETLFVWWLKAALIESGRTYTQNWPKSNDDVAASLHPDKRAIAPSLALVRATRMHIIQLISYVPDAWEHYTVDEHGEKMTFRSLINLLIAHSLEHIDEIVAICHKYKL
jgi:catechol 2,3-dioxygenase-like lactoylglutathione lyase family enzyme